MNTLRSCLTLIFVLGTNIAFCNAQGYEIPGIDNIFLNPNVDPGFARPTPGLWPSLGVWDRIYGLSRMRSRSDYDIPGFENIINNPNVDPLFSRPVGGRPKWPKWPSPWKRPRIPPSWLRGK